VEIEVDYGERTYGTGFGVTNYKVTIRQSKIIKMRKREDGISIQFHFFDEMPGKGNYHLNEASVKNGRISLSNEDAIILAQAIISHVILGNEDKPTTLECIDGKYLINGNVSFT